MDNYYEVEQPLINRLRALLPSMLVESADYLESIEEDDTGFAPAVFVLPVGSDFDKNDIQRETQTWQVALIVPHYRDDDAASSSITTAGGYLKTIVDGLKGWTPYQGYTPLLPTGPASPEYMGGLAGFPLNFETTRILC